MSCRKSRGVRCRANISCGFMTLNNAYNFLLCHVLAPCLSSTRYFSNANTEKNRAIVSQYGKFTRYQRSSDSTQRQLRTWNWVFIRYDHKPEILKDIFFLEVVKSIRTGTGHWGTYLFSSGKSRGMNFLIRPKNQEAKNNFQPENHGAHIAKTWRFLSLATVFHSRDKMGARVLTEKSQSSEYFSSRNIPLLGRGSKFFSLSYHFSGLNFIAEDECDDEVLSHFRKHYRLIEC